MSLGEPQLRGYLAPTQGAPWRWSADGKAVVLLDGTTLAFREELAQAVERSGLRGLPPFGSIVYLLLACHERWRTNGELRGHLLGVLNFTLRRKSVDLDPLLKRMDVIGQMSATVRKGVEAKAFLIAAVFEDAQLVLSGDEARAVLQALRNGVPVEWLAPQADDGGDAILRELRAMQGGTLPGEPELLSRRETGLDAPALAAADLDLPDSLRVRHLLNTLSEDSDPELAGLARLALNLLAAVHVPRPLTHEDELPLGGYTDIVNRGALDRLLLSELAHDDTTLAARVALNEALYLRRESPPQNPWIDRTILIDAGLRMWGLPRVYGTAAALALVAAGTGRTRLRVLRAEQASCVKVELSTREGLLEHLAALEPEAHPGPALENLLEQEPADAPAELTLITHPDALQDPEFRASLPRDREIFVATVSRGGAFELLATSAMGRKNLCAAQLDIEKILTERPARKKHPLGPVDATLPLALSVNPFPLRVPHSISPGAYGYSDVNGLFAVSRDGRLTWWPAPHKAPKTLSTAVPAGKVLRVEVRETRVLVLVSRQRPNEVLLFTWDIVHRRHEILPLETRGGLPRHIEVSDTTIALVFGARILSYALVSGTITRELEIPLSTVWVHDRFFRRGTQWLVLNLASGAAELMECREAENNWMILFDREATPGPWALHRAGAVISTLDSRRIEISGIAAIVEVKRVSRDGNRLLVRNPKRETVLLDLKAGSADRLYHDDPLYLERMLESEAGKFLQPPFSLRTRLKSIGFDSDGHPILVTRKGLCITLDTRRSDQRMHIREHDDGDRVEHTHFAPFETFEHPGESRFELTVARFESGGRVILDSRGLLHFAPVSGTHLSIVLFDTHVTGWSSDGFACVDEFFGHDGQPVSDTDFFQKICAFGLRCR